MNVDGTEVERRLEQFEAAARHAGIKKDSLVALNTAFAIDGLFIYVPRGQVLEDPVQVVHLPMTGVDTMLHYRNMFIMEENASAEVIVCDHTLSPFRFLTNSVTEIYAGSGARFHYSWNTELADRLG